MWALASEGCSFRNLGFSAAAPDSHQVTAALRLVIQSIVQVTYLNCRYPSGAFRRRHRYEQRPRRRRILHHRRRSGLPMIPRPNTRRKVAGSASMRVGCRCFRPMAPMALPHKHKAS
jgi:hypothetical protein